MRRKILGVVLMLAVSGLVGAAAQEQEQKQEQEAPAAAKDVILRFIGGVGNKLVTAAEEFPGELYDYRPLDYASLGYAPFDFASLDYASLDYARDRQDRRDRRDRQDKPNEEVRTFGEILVHVARSNDLIVSRVAERPPSDLKQFAYTNKAEATLKKSFEDVVAAIEKNPDPKGMPAWLYAVNHGSEHYGNLVTYYRLNGLVPPASR